MKQKAISFSRTFVKDPWCSCHSKRQSPELSMIDSPKYLRKLGSNTEGIHTSNLEKSCKTISEEFSLLNRYSLRKKKFGRRREEEETPKITHLYEIENILVLRHLFPISDKNIVFFLPYCWCHFWYWVL